MVSGSLSLPSRGSFHLSLTVLFSIGRLVVFSLWGWSPFLQAEFLVLHLTPDSILSALYFAYVAFTLFGQVFQTCSALLCSTSDSPYPGWISSPGLGLFHFARRYFGNRCFFLFLQVLRCFSSLRSLPHIYLIRYGILSFYSQWVPSFGDLRV